MNKPRLHIAFYVLTIGLSWIIVGISNASQKKKPCKEFHVVLKNDRNNYFLDVNEVRNMVRTSFGSPIEGTKIGQLKLADFESLVQQNEFVENAEAYKESSGDMVVEIALKQPIARVNRKYSPGFYLDEDFSSFSLSRKFAANVILISGAPFNQDSAEDSLMLETLDKIKPMVNFIHKNEILQSQISEIYIKENGSIILYPELGDIPIYFGKPERIGQKFNYLLTFYTEVLNNVGWDQYKKIDLSYKGQIIATKKN